MLSNRLPVIFFVISALCVGCVEDPPDGHPEADPSLAAPLAFTDVTQVAGIDFRNVAGESELVPVIDQNGQGACFLDYNADGWPDVYLVNGSTLERWREKKNPGNRLYRNERDGTFTDVTAEASVRGKAWGCGCAVADYDGDGWVDLYVTNWGPNLFYRNNGDGTFTDVTQRAGVDDPRWSSSAAFGDVDADGDLDLYVSNYVKFDPDRYPTHDPEGRPCHYKGIPAGCDPRLYEGERDTLYRNNGDGTFSDVTSASGLDGTAGFRGFGVLLLDLDLDGDLDLYVGNDVMPNLYFANRGDGTFVNVGPPRGGEVNALGEAESSMGVAAGDIDGDGAPEIHLTHFADETNTLYQNRSGILTDITEQAGLSLYPGELGWGNALIDLNVDGLLDLFVANGHVYPQADRLGNAEETFHQVNRLYLGAGGGRFKEVPFELKKSPRTAVSSRGLAIADYDNDGDLDLLVVNYNTSPALLRNEHRGNFLTLTLRAAHPNTAAIGATVALRAGGKTMWRFSTPNQGYQSSHDPRLHFGLGEATVVEEITVKWPSGRTEQLPGPLAGNRFLVIREGREAVEVARHQ